MKEVGSLSQRIQEGIWSSNQHPLAEMRNKRFAKYTDIHKAPRYSCKFNHNSLISFLYFFSINFSSMLVILSMC